MSLDPKVAKEIAEWIESEQEAINLAGDDWKKRAKPFINKISILIANLDPNLATDDEIREMLDGPNEN